MSMEHDGLEGGSLQGEHGLRAAARNFLENDVVEIALAILIVVNGIMLGLETSPTIVQTFGTVLAFADEIVLSIFVIELVVRMYAYGKQFWGNGWGLFDLFVITLSLVPAAGNLSVLRSLRVIRALRLISAVPSVRQVVNGLLSAIPGMGAIIMLLGIIFYVFSVMATRLFGDAFPKLFGTIGSSAYSLFQIMTLEAWSDSIVRPMMEVFPWAWAFFIPFILVTSFTVLNLFIGIIVEGMQSETNSKKQVEERARERRQDDLIEDVRSIKISIEAMRKEKR